MFGANEHIYIQVLAFGVTFARSRVFTVVSGGGVVFHVTSVKWEN